MRWHLYQILIVVAITAGVSVVAFVRFMHH